MIIDRKRDRIKKSKGLMFFIIGFMLITGGVFTSAMDCDGTMLGTFKQNTNINLRQICDTCSYVTLSSVTYPNSTTLTINTNMSKVGIDYNYSFNVATLGSHYYSVFGDKDGTIATETFCFEVTPTWDDRGFSLFLILIIFSLGLFVLAYVIDMDWLIFLSGILWVITGVYSMIYGVGDLADLYTRTIAGVSWAIGIVLVVAAIFNISKSEGNISDEE